MPRSSGTYSLPLSDVTSGEVISSTHFNTTLNDVATALTNSLAKDGQTAPTANLGMAGFRHTSVGKASARDQYATVEQIQDAEIWTIGSITGTNTITGSVTPAITAFASGMRFQFIPANTNTGAVTIAVNGLSAKNITKNGTAALGAGDLVAGNPATVIYDGTRFVLQNPAAAMTSDTFTPTFTFSTAGDLSVAYSAQEGSYWLFDNDICYYRIYLWCTPTFTTSSGEVRIASLPFTHASNVGNTPGVFSLESGTIDWNSRTQLISRVSVSQSYISLVSQGSGVATSSILASDFTSGATYVMTIAGNYPVA